MCTNGSGTVQNVRGKKKKETNLSRNLLDCSHGSVKSFMLYLEATPVNSALL